MPEKKETILKGIYKKKTVENKAKFTILHPIKNYQAFIEAEKL